MDEREVLQGVRVFGVDVDGSDVNVDVYGSPSHVCGSLKYTISRGSERRAKVRLLREWALSGTPVTMVTSGASITLVDDRALIEHLLADGDLVDDGRAG